MSFSMKYKLFLCTFFLFFCTLPDQAQQVRIKAKEVGRKSLSFSIAWPYNGYSYFNSMFTKRYSIDSVNTYTFNLGDRKGGVFEFSFGYEHIRLLLFPKDTITLQVKVDSLLWYKVEGTNAKGHMLWLQKTCPSYVIYPMWDRNLGKRHTPNDRYKAICKAVDSTSMQFAQLRKNGDISDQYYKSILLVYKGMVYQHFLSYHSRKDVAWTKVRPYANIFLKNVRWEDASQHPFISELLATYSTETFVADSARFFTDKKILPAEFQYSRFVPDKNRAREFILANMIYLYASDGYDSGDWPTAYRYFKSHYKKSALSQQLDSLIAPYLKPEAPVSKEFIDEKRNNLDELMAPMKGNAFFVDLWATWCGPCRQEMIVEKHTDFKTFLDSLHIKRLYLSIDDDKSDNLWRRAVDILKLEGIHHRVSAALYDDLQKRVYGNEPFFVPRYLFIDRNGKLLDGNLPRLVDLDKLKSKLLFYITNESVTEGR